MVATLRNLSPAFLIHISMIISFFTYWRTVGHVFVESRPLSDFGATTIVVRYCGPHWRLEHECNLMKPFARIPYAYIYDILEFHK